MQKMTIKIAGMNCHHCKMAVEKVLSGINGVSDTVVNLTEGIAEVSYEADKVGVSQLQQAIEGAGYQVIELY